MADEGRSEKTVTPRLSMQSLIGDRFLKRFFGSRLQRSRANANSEALILPDNEEKPPSAEKPAEQGCPPSEVLPEKEAELETTKKQVASTIQ
jgi:hypothetical protein